MKRKADCLGRAAGPGLWSHTWKAGEEDSGDALSWRLKVVNDKLESSVRVFLVLSKPLIYAKIQMQMSCKSGSS